MDEQQAIVLLKAGNIGGLEYLVARYQVKAVRAAFLITQDAKLAEDIVQDTFVGVYKTIRSFDAARPFEPWFLRSVVNASIKASRKKARHIPFEDEATEAAIHRLLSSPPAVEYQVESRLLEEQVWSALQELSPRQRAVITQRYFLGMTEAEMAEQSGRSKGTVKWLLNAARERLRHLLAEGNDR
jgi:RNA polymerase sigma-70 factor, ECF subfamily